MQGRITHLSAPQSKAAIGYAQKSAKLQANDTCRPWGWRPMQNHPIRVRFPHGLPQGSAPAVPVPVDASKMFLHRCLSILMPRASRDAVNQDNDTGGTA